MKNYKITIQYDGSRYNGWQRQGNTKNTLQEKFENVLSLMCERNIEIFASGRTDSGVHAKCQVANFKCKTEKNDLEILDYLNRYLPDDILVTSIQEESERFHSRLNAKSKTYEYKIATKKPDVFIRKYVYKADKTIDINKMKEASKLLLGKHDFLGFSSVKKTKKSTERTINFIEITESNNIITIKINATGFLYNMVRIISGTLYQIGSGELDILAINKTLETKSRENAGITLPPQGLTLVEVIY